MHLNLKICKGCQWVVLKEVTLPNEKNVWLKCGACGYHEKTDKPVKMDVLTYSDLAPKAKPSQEK